MYGFVPLFAVRGVGSFFRSTGSDILADVRFLEAQIILRMTGSGSSRPSSCRKATLLAAKIGNARKAGKSPWLSLGFQARKFRSSVGEQRLHNIVRSPKYLMRACIIFSRLAHLVDAIICAKSCPKGIGRGADMICNGWRLCTHRATKGSMSVSMTVWR